MEAYLTRLDSIIDTNYPNYRWESTYAGGKDICGYFPLYEKHLPQKVDNFLEIGIAMGISIKMFRDFYEGAGTFHAMNMHWGNAGVISKSELSKHGFICHEGDQSDLEFLKTIDTQFDVITDDGSHRSDHQVITFQRMFNHNLKPGGVYIIEDLHCCLDPYWWGDVGDFNNTMLNLLLGYSKTKTVSINNIFSTRHPVKTFETDEFFEPYDIENVYLYNPSIAFIYKKWS